jgi:hypothetical protein
MFGRHNFPCVSSLSSRRKKIVESVAATEQQQKEEEDRDASRQEVSLFSTGPKAESYNIIVHVECPDMEGSFQYAESM